MSSSEEVRYFRVVVRGIDQPIEEIRPIQFIQRNSSYRQLWVTGLNW
jgi:hypothetical protein